LIVFFSDKKIAAENGAPKLQSILRNSDGLIFLTLADVRSCTGWSAILREVENVSFPEFDLKATYKDGASSALKNRYVVTFNLPGQNFNAVDLFLIPGLLTLVKPRSMQNETEGN
jgi:hypothetical protein